MNEGQSGFGVSFKVFCKSAIDAEPCEGSLDDPAFWQDDKAFGVVGALDDFYGSWAVALRDGAGISTIGHDFFNERETLRDAIQHKSRSVPVLDGGGMNVGVQNQPQNINGNMTFAAFDIFATVKAGIALRIRACFRGLGVDHRQCRAFLPALQIAHGPVQSVMDAFPCPVSLPVAEIPVNRLPGRKVFGQHVPLAAGLQ